MSLAPVSSLRQYKNQTLWDPILAYGPQAYLWLGDVVYVKEEHGLNLRAAFKLQLAQPGYQRLLKTGAVVEGVFDDHDYGVNDGLGKVGDPRTHTHAYTPSYLF
jgi:alkaline phosphatase D